MTSRTVIQTRSRTSAKGMHRTKFRLQWSLALLLLAVFYLRPGEAQGVCPESVLDFAALNKGGQQNFNTAEQRSDVGSGLCVHLDVDAALYGLADETHGVRQLKLTGQLVILVKHRPRETCPGQTTLKRWLSRYLRSLTGGTVLLDKDSQVTGITCCTNNGDTCDLSAMNTNVTVEDSPGLRAPDALQPTMSFVGTTLDPAAGKRPLRNVTRPTLESCQRLCLMGVPGCSTYTYNQRLEQCVLFRETIISADELDRCDSCVTGVYTPATCSADGTQGFRELSRTLEGFPDQPNDSWLLVANSKPTLQRTPNECNCRCLGTPGCTAFNYVMQPEGSLCYLLAFLDWSKSRDPLPRTSFRNILGRVVGSDAVRPDCRWLPDEQGRPLPNTGVVQSRVSNIRDPNPSREPTWRECNARCLSEPGCVAYTTESRFMAGSVNQSVSSVNCMLFSAIARTQRQQGVDLRFPQSCTQVPSTSLLPPPPPPSTLPPRPVLLPGPTAAQPTPQVVTAVPPPPRPLPPPPPVANPPPALTTRDFQLTGSPPPQPPVITNQASPPPPAVNGIVGPDQSQGGDTGASQASRSASAGTQGASVSSSDASGLNKGTKLAIGLSAALGGVVLLLLAVGFLMWYRAKQRWALPKATPPGAGGAPPPGGAGAVAAAGDGAGAAAGGVAGTAGAFGAAGPGAGAGAGAGASASRGLGYAGAGAMGAGAVGAGVAVAGATAAGASLLGSTSPPSGSGGAEPPRTASGRYLMGFMRSGSAVNSRGMIRTYHICPNKETHAELCLGSNPNAKGSQGMSHGSNNSNKSSRGPGSAPVVKSSSKRYINVDAVLSEAAEKLQSESTMLSGQITPPSRNDSGRMLVPSVSISRRLFGYLPSLGNAKWGHETLITADELQKVLGLPDLDPFMASVASQYSWTFDSMDSMLAVESGSGMSKLLDPLPCRLSPREVATQLHLFARGLVYAGPSSLVFKARWPAKFGPHAMLACKVMRNPSGPDGHDLLESYKEEVDMLAKCRHTNIVRMYGYCLTGPIMCIIMELLPTTLQWRLGLEVKPLRNPSLKRNFSSQGYLVPNCTPSLSSGEVKALDREPLSKEEAVQLGLDIASGLVQVHSRTNQRKRRPSLGVLQEEPPDFVDVEKAELKKTFGSTEPWTPADLGLEAYSPPDKAARALAHGDLQPCNILLTSLGRAKISGFGSGKKVLCAGYDGEVKAVPYCAPEVLNGLASKSGNQKFDIYSFGVIMYEIVAQKAAWDGFTDSEIWAKVKAGERPPTPFTASSAPTPGQVTPVQLPTSINPSHANSDDDDDVLGDALMPDTPPMLSEMPQLASLIRLCWAHMPRTRPVAQNVVKGLVQEQVKLTHVYNHT